MGTFKFQITILSSICTLLKNQLKLRITSIPQSRGSFEKNFDFIYVCLQHGNRQLCSLFGLLFSLKLLLMPVGVFYVVSMKWIKCFGCWCSVWLLRKLRKTQDVTKQELVLCFWFGFFTDLIELKLLSRVVLILCLQTVATCFQAWRSKEGATGIHLTPLPLISHTEI